MTAVGIMASGVHIAAAAAFPVVAGVSSESGPTLGTSNQIPNPAGVAVGDLLIVHASNDATATPPTTTATPGWTQIAVQTVPGLPAAAHVLAVFARLADGTANDTMYLATATGTDYCASVLRITGHGVTNVATDIKTATAVNEAGSANADPPSLDAGTSKLWLWVTAAAVDSTAPSQMTATPTGYTQAHTILLSAGTGSSSTLCVASRELAAQTENPPVFTTVSRPWMATTIAIPPA